MTDWSLANCQGLDPDLWFPPRGREGAPLTARAKQVCSECVIREACLAHAIEHDEVHGTWGGLSADERRALRRRRLPEHGRRRLPEHGTRRRYQGGCRCEDCRAANAAYRRRYRTS